MVKAEHGQSRTADPSPTPSPSSSAVPSPVSNSSKRIDQPGKKKYVKQVTGRHNDTELHLAARRGDLTAVRKILRDIDSQMLRTLSGADLEAEVTKVRVSLVNEVNELGETALFTAADRGHLEVVKELLKYSNKECVIKRSNSGFNALHIAACQGHNGNKFFFNEVCIFVTYPKKKLHFCHEGEKILREDICFDNQTTMALMSAT